MSKKLSTLGVGTTFEVPVKSAYRSFLGDYVVFKMADKNHLGYPSGAITLITDKIIALLCSDAKEPNNSDSNRRSYGNNRHIHSNILQWLNSNAAAGKWYSAKHGQDAPPSSANVWDNVNPYDTWAGFLAMLDDDFVAALMTTTLTVAKNTVTDGGSYETFTAKMFLASTTEVGLANENGIAEGSKLALFSDNTSRLAYCTQAAIDKSNYGSDPTTSQAWYWWLRAPYSGNSCYVRNVNTSGALDVSGASYGHWGVRPLCNLKSDILVSYDEGEVNERKPSFGEMIGKALAEGLNKAIFGEGEEPKGILAEAEAQAARKKEQEDEDQKRADAVDMMKHIAAAFDIPATIGEGKQEEQEKEVKQLFGWYSELKKAGFTDAQAFELIKG